MLLNTIFIKCPECKKIFQTIEMLSGNTFGALFYSDGFLLAPMYKNQQLLLKCTNCYSFFWQNDNIVELNKYANHFDEYYYNLSMNDYITYLNENNNITDQQELYIRKEIRWLYNHDFRNKNVELKLDSFQIENLKKLINLYEILLNKDDYLVNKADILRNLGLFDKAEQTISRISDIKSDYTLKILNAIKQKNNAIFEL